MNRAAALWVVLILNQSAHAGYIIQHLHVPWLLSEEDVNNRNGKWYMCMYRYTTTLHTYTLQTGHKRAEPKVHINFQLYENKMYTYINYM